MNDYEFYFNSEYVPDHLKGHFIKVVHAGTPETVPKGTAIGTYGLGGCVAVHIDNPNTDTMLHYFPTRVDDICKGVEQQAFEGMTRKVSFFVAEEDEQDESGKWQPRSEPIEAQKDFEAAVSCLEARNIPYQFYQYAGEAIPTPMSGGTFIVDQDGRAFFSGLQIYGPDL